MKTVQMVLANASPPGSETSRQGNLCRIVDHGHVDQLAFGDFDVAAHLGVGCAIVGYDVINTLAELDDMVWLSHS